MADIELEKKHSFDFETARSKSKEWLEKLKSEYGLDVEYTEGDCQDKALVQRSGVKARAFLDADKIRFEADLSFIAKPMKGKLAEMVQTGLDKHFT